MTEALVKSLAQFDTPTISNAIEVAQGQRGFDAFTRGTMVSAMGGVKAIVGYARTAKIAGLNPPSESPDIIKSRRLDYFHYMASGPTPSICAIEDTDYPDCVSAWWGEVHTAVHKGLGMSGALTNGVMRDLDDLESGFPVIAGSIGPSHKFVHVQELDTPVEVMGLTINPGDLVHADRHGAVVIPPEVLPNLGDAIKTLLASEQIILGPAREPSFDIDALMDAWKAFEKART